MGDSHDRRPGRRRWIGGFSVPWRVTFRFGSRKAPGAGTGTTKSSWRWSKRRGPDARSHRFLPDALPFEAPPLLAQSPGPENDRRQRLRRGTALAGLAALLLLGIVIATFGPRGFMDVHRAMRERDDLKDAVDARQEAVLALRRQVQRLQDEPRAMEGIARESLGFAKPGEITFVLPGDGIRDGALRRGAKSVGEATPTAVPGPG